MRMTGRVALTAGLLFSLVFAAEANEKPWLEVRSPHFRVLTDASAGDARRVAREFEQMRGVFASQYPNFRLDSGAPLVIFVARDEETAKALAPNLWKIKGVKPAGYFQQSWEKKYALIRMDAFASGAQKVVLHEYTHSLLHMNAHWLPTWLDEGIAEFYAYTQFRGTETLIGVPTDRFRALRWQTPIPVEILISVDRRSPYYHDEDKVQMFYAESWALVHYLVFAPEMGQGKKLDEFFQMLQHGVDQKKAFLEAFGSFKDMDRAIDAYARQVGLHAGVFKNQTEANDKEYATRTLTMAETQAEIGGYHLWTRDIANARAYVNDALQNDPKNGLAHEEQGLMDLREGKDAESLAELTQAFSLDNTLYLSLFAKTMLSPMAVSNDPAQEELFKKELMAVIRLNPNYAPAFVQMARLAVKQNDLQLAFACSRKAEDLEPFRAGYHLQTGQILLRMGKGTDAANYAKFVAERWFGPDHNEALELWNRVPAGQRPLADPMTETAPKDTQEAEGVLTSVTCGKDEEWAMQLDHKGKSLTFHRKGGFPFGFSDSLWYGEDHMTLCHHLEGLRTIVHYRPAANSTYAGDVAEIEIRDDLPTIAPVAAASPRGTEPTASKP